MRVKASRDGADSAWTAPGWQVTASVPGAPGAPALALRERQFINVSSSGPYDGGSPITHYRLVVWKDDDSGLEVLMNGTVVPATPSGGLSYTLGALETGGYAIAIAASNAVGTSLWSKFSYAPFIRPPDAPADVVAWPDDNGIHVDWEPPDNSVGELRYDVRISLPDDSDVRQVWGLYETSYSTTSKLAMEVRNGTTYAIEVRAVGRDYNNGNTRLNGFWSDKVFVTPGPPPLPPRFDDALPGDGQVSLAWTPTPYGDPSDNANETTSYTLQWRSEQQDYHADRQVTTGDTLYTITGLTNMTEYDVRVKATNAAGDSDWSERSARTAWPPAAPAQPHVTRGSGPGELVVSWSEPPDNGAVITSYTVSWQSAFIPDGTPSNDWWYYNNAYVLGWWGSGKYAEVYNAAGRWQDISGANTWVASVWLPDRVVRSPVFQSLQEVQLWAEYVVDNPDFDTVYEATISDTTYTITDLPHDVPHDVRVKATNAAGDSDWSPDLPPQSGVAYPPGAPTAALTPEARQIQVSWSEPPDNGAAITSYTVRWQGVVPDRAPSSVWKLVSDPVWGDMYRYILPDDSWPEAAVVEESWNGGWVAVVWQSENDSRGSPVTSLEEALLWAEAVMDNPDFDDTVYRVTTSNTTYTISELFNDTRYEVKVKATNAAGDSEWSSTVYAKTPRPPGAPYIGENSLGNQVVGVIVYLTAQFDLHFTMCWDDPDSDGGSAITSYVIQWRRKDAGNWNNPQQVSVPNTGPYWFYPDWPEEPYLVEGECHEGDLDLEYSDDGYLFRVSAVNAAGQGPWSNTRKPAVGSIW